MSTGRRQAGKASARATHGENEAEERVALHLPSSSIMVGLRPQALLALIVPPPESALPGSAGISGLLELRAKKSRLQ